MSITTGFADKYHFEDLEMKIFCKHQWKVLSTEYTKSMLEHMKEADFHPPKVNKFSVQRQFIQLVSCEKCGKLKRFTV